MSAATPLAHEPLIQTLARLLKLPTLYELNNQAIQRALQQSAPLLQEACAHVEGGLSLLCAGELIFLGGQPLRASRQCYQLAHELGALLERLGVNELTFAPGLQPQDLLALLSHVQAVTQRGQPAMEADLSPHVRLRLVQTGLLLGHEDRAQSPEERVAHTCATALVIMERLHEQSLRGDFSLVRQAKRLARDLVALATQTPEALLDFIGASSHRGDEAMLAVKGAALATLTARHLTRDLRNLADLALTALLYDTGKLRAAGMLRHAQRRGLEVAPQLHDDALDRLPEATAAMMARFGQLNESSLARSVYSYEAHLLLRRDTRALPYEGALAPTMEALILATVRDYLERVSLDLQRNAVATPDEAIVAMVERAPSRLERLVIQLFTHALHLYPASTPVALSSGARAVVTANHRRPSQFARPRVCLVYDPHGVALTPVRELDLSADDPECVALGTIIGKLRQPDARVAQVVRAMLVGRVGAPSHDVHDVHEPPAPMPAPVPAPVTRAPHRPSHPSFGAQPIAATPSPSPNFAPLHQPLTPPITASQAAEDDDDDQDIETSVTLGSQPSDRVEMLRASDLAHLFPATFSELDAPLPQPREDEDDDADIFTSVSHIAAPGTWDRSLEEAAPEARSGGVQMLTASALDEISDGFEATALLPRAVIATFQIHDQRDDDAQEPDS